MTTALAFQTTTFNVVTRNNQPWLTGPEIAHALGYSRADKISEIYRRNIAEFTPAMTETLKLRVSQSGGYLTRETRIFSLRGAHLLAMLARTPVAADFRRWVLDILDRETAVPPAPTFETKVASIPGVFAPLIADPYQHYRDAAEWACKLGHRHGRGALVVMLAQFDADHLYRVPANLLPDFVARCRKILGVAQPQPAALPAPTTKPQGRQWKDPAKVEELLKSMRFREDEMYDQTLISPDSVVQLVYAGKVGPRQWAKLKGLMTA